MTETRATSPQIIHFTTVHSRLDTRVRFKQAEGLARHYPGKVALYVMDSDGDESCPSTLQIKDVGARTKGRIARILAGNWHMFWALHRARPNIAHFHDPELIPAGVMLRLMGIKIVYDIHENLPKQVLEKPYIRPRWLRRIIARIVGVIEGVAVRLFDAAAVASPEIGARFPTDKTILIRNFPRADLMPKARARPLHQDHFVINYSGSLTHIRGITDLINAMALLPKRFELHLYGSWQPAGFQEQCQALAGWQKCTFHGRLPHDDIIVQMQLAHLGVQLTHDIPNHTGGLATKVFEYLFLGVPVLMSDTPEKRRIYGDLVHFVRPSDPQAIAETFKRIAQNYEAISAEARTKTTEVRRRYAWEAEQARLIHLYDRFMNSRQDKKAAGTSLPARKGVGDENNTV